MTILLCGSAFLKIRFADFPSPEGAERRVHMTARFFARLDFSVMFTVSLIIGAAGMWLYLPA
jgi:hypothetical protein